MHAPERSIAEALRQAVEHDVLVPDQSNGSFRFRHALFAEAVYATLLPGEREELHARLAGALTQNPALAASRAIAGELAQHWVAARKPVQALGASLQAARDAQALSGLGEALRHLEQVLELWDDVPTAENLAGLALPAVLAWAAELAGMTARSDADEIDARALAGILGVGESADAKAVAARLGRDARRGRPRPSPCSSATASSSRPATAPSAPARLAVSEARELYPLAVVLESIAVRQSPPFGRQRAGGDAPRQRAHARRAARPVRPRSSPTTTSTAAHRRLRQRAAARRAAPVKRALLRYEQIYMRDPSASSARSPSTTRSSRRSSAATTRWPPSACART